jgi:hypothetical protein
MAVISGPGVVQMTVGGVLIGTNIANSGKDLGTYNTASITGIVPANTQFCGIMRKMGMFFPYRTTGSKVTISYLE